MPRQKNIFCITLRKAEGKVPGGERQMRDITGREKISSDFEKMNQKEE
jgi:hypothetical protein